MTDYPVTTIPVGGSSTIENQVVLTVWKKSLLFNCDGFTVIDSNGNLVFRVDNYVPGGNGEIVLMDASGCSLLTIRRKRLRLSDKWLVYDGETVVNPLFSLMKRVTLLKTKSLAYVTAAELSKKYMNISSNKSHMIYEIEGSYAQRRCVVYDEKRRCLADIRPKEAKGVHLGRDVFDLVMQQPLIDPANAMAIVVILDQMFGLSRRFRT